MNQKGLSLTIPRMGRTRFAALYISSVTNVLTFYLLLGNDVLSGSSVWAASGLEHGSIIISRLVLADGNTKCAVSHPKPHTIN